MEDSSPLVQPVSATEVSPIIHSRTPIIEPGGSSPKLLKVRQDGHYEKEGKRWVRRRDNSRFVGNKHIVKPSSKDFNLASSAPRATFPKPLPPYLPRHLSAPSASTPHRDPASANAGRYSLSLKGVRKELRRAGPGAEQIVRDIEQELTEWLRTGGILLSPDVQRALSPLRVSGKPIGSLQSIMEVHRSPTELIWRVDADFPRFLLHCVSRFHNVVSFSKTVAAADGDVRLTHLLRPNVTRPDFMAPGALDTPPPSDIETQSVRVDTEESDFDAASVLATVSEEGDPTDVHSRRDESRERRARSLERQDSPEGRHRLASLVETESVDSGEYELEDDDPLSMSIGSLSLGNDLESYDWDRTPRRRGSRAVSSPSRSPARPLRRTPRRNRAAPIVGQPQLGFWHYVFS